MNTKLPGIEKLYKRIIEEIKEEEEKCFYLMKIYSDLISALSEASALHFNTLFARKMRPKRTCGVR